MNSSGKQTELKQVARGSLAMNGMAKKSIPKASEPAPKEGKKYCIKMAFHLQLLCNPKYLTSQPEKRSLQESLHTQGTARFHFVSAY